MGPATAERSTWLTEENGRRRQGQNMRLETSTSVVDSCDNASQNAMCQETERQAGATDRERAVAYISTAWNAPRSLKLGATAGTNIKF
jgi:hypothetical protein